MSNRKMTGQARYERLGTEVTYTNTPTHTLDFVDAEASVVATVSVFVDDDGALVVLVNDNEGSGNFAGEVRVAVNGSEEAILNLKEGEE